VLPGRDIFVEAPASAPAETDEVYEVRLPSGRAALVLSPEDVLMYRLHEFVATGHPGVAEQAVALLHAREIEVARLERIAKEEGLSRALGELRLIADRVDRGETLEPFELHDIARRLQNAKDEWPGRASRTFALGSPKTKPRDSA
jgi:hypothetical protein